MRFYRSSRPPLRTGEYVKYAGAIGTALAALTVFAGGAIAGAPVHVTLRSVLSPVLGFFLADQDLVGWMARSAWVQQAPWIFLVLTCGLSTIALILFWPSNRNAPEVVSGPRLLSRRELQTHLNAEIAREEKRHRKSGA